MIKLNKNDFPLLQQTSRGKPLVYFDTSATSQKPQVVIDALQRYYIHDNANIHRGVYELSERATQHYESVREKVRQLINAASTQEIIFTKGTTESINLIAYSFGSSQLKTGDEILISGMEHHSNIVPWQIACERVGAHLKIIPVLDNGELDLNAYQQLLSHKTKLVALIHVSNVLGTINPVKKMIEWAHEKNIPVLLDGAQAIAHQSVDVRELDCDFYAFSSHKMYGPTGVGVLYGKRAWLEQLPPYQSGGDMISTVTFEKTTYNVLPYKFEAGTPNIADVIGFGAAIDYFQSIGFTRIIEHEKKLLDYANTLLKTIPNLRIIGNSSKKIGVISFVMPQAHPHDIGTILDQQGIAVRAGHHCAMPLMERFQIPATVRISFGLYNDEQDVDRLIEGLHEVLRIFN